MWIFQLAMLVYQRINNACWVDRNLWGLLYKKMDEIRRNLLKDYHPWIHLSCFILWFCYGARRKSILIRIRGMKLTMCLSSVETRGFLGFTPWRSTLLGIFGFSAKNPSRPIWRNLSIGWFAEFVTMVTMVIWTPTPLGISNSEKTLLGPTILFYPTSQELL